MNFSDNMIIGLFFLFCFLLFIFTVVGIGHCQDTSNNLFVVDTIEVKGEFTYLHCLNECGIVHDHYITHADVMIRNDCVADYDCTVCLDECAAELKENNPEVYKSIFDNTIREEF